MERPVSTGATLRSLPLLLSLVFAADAHQGDHATHTPAPVDSGMTECCTVSECCIVDQIPGIQTLIDSGATAPSAALDARSGAAYLAWNSGGQVMFSRRAKGEPAFQPPLAVRWNAGTAPPVLAVGPEGQVYLLTGAGSGTGLQLAHSSDGGRHFTETAPLPGAETADPRRADLAIAPDGTLLCAWVGTVDGTLHLLRAAEGGRRFEAVQLPTRGAVPAPPALAAGADGRLYAAWWQAGKGTGRIAVARSADGGRTWGAPGLAETAEPLTSALPAPRLGADAAGRVFVAWSCTSPGSKGSCWAAADSSLHFQAGDALSLGADAALSQPRLQLDGRSQVHLAGVAGGYVYHSLRAFPPSSQAFAPGSNPSLAVAGRTLLLAWTNAGALRAYLADLP